MPNQNIPIAGLAVAPEIPVEGFHGLSLRNGVAKINCFTQRFDPVANQNYRAAAAILAFPINDLIEFSRTLAETLDILRAQGAIPGANLGTPETAPQASSPEASDQDCLKTPGVSAPEDGAANLQAPADNGGSPAADANAAADPIHIEADPAIR